MQVDNAAVAIKFVPCFEALSAVVIAETRYDERFAAVTKTLVRAAGWRLVLAGYKLWEMEGVRTRNFQRNWLSIGSKIAPYLPRT